jgi:hypothetical protein
MLGTTKSKYNHTLPIFPSFELPARAKEVL